MNSTTIEVDWHDLSFHPVANLFPLIDGPEFDELVSDIATNGQFEPIWLNSTDNTIIDGRNRYRACLAAGVVPAFRRWDGSGSLVQFVLSLNLHRRHLTSSQRATAAVESLPMLEAEAKERQGARTDLNPTLGKNLPNVDDTPDDRKATAQAAKLFGTNRSYVAKAKNLKEGDPELFEAVQKGKTTIQKAHDQYKRESVEKRKRTEIEHAEQWPDWLIVGDFRTAGMSVPDNSIDLIFTDPPYDKEASQLYGDLAEFALRVLKPGGVLIAYSGQMHLPDIYHGMGLHLEYMWTCAIGHSGGSTTFRKWRLDNLWKPLLMYGKAPIVPWWQFFSDWTTGGKEKTTHPWQQSQAEAEHFIAALSPVNGIVCDPFVGGGTTLAAAKRLGRRYIGFEIAAAAASAARERVEGATYGAN